MTTDLNDYRARRAQAIACHPSTWMPIAWPADAIETAQQFAAELDNAERGRPDKPRWTSKLFGRSRFRRAKIYDGLAVALLIALAAVMGCILVLASAPHAKADGATDAYEWQYGPAACGYLSTHPTLAGLSAVLFDAQGLGLTAEQAGEAVASSVFDLCPEHIPLLRLFVQRFGPKQVA